MTNEQHLKEAVSKMITIDFNDKSWWISWWMLLDPEPSFKAILSAMDAAREDEAGELFTEDEVCMIYDFFVIEKRQSFRSALQEYKNEKK